MFGFALLFAQILFVQYALSQTIASPSNMNNGMPSSFGQAGYGTASLAAANMGSGLAGQMMANGLSTAAFGAMGPQALGIQQNQMGMPATAHGIQQHQMGMPVTAHGIQQNQMGMPATALGIQQNQMGMPAAVAANNLAAGYISSYGGSGSGDVAVAGELPVAGTTAITGQVPMSGKVQFTGTLPAGGIVTISGQCGCGMNNGQINAPFGAKSVYNNKPYMY